MSDKGSSKAAWIAGIASIVMSVLIISTSATLSVYLVPLTTEFGVSVGQASLLFTMTAIGSLVLTFFVGTLVKKMGVRVSIVIGGLAVAQFGIVMNLANSIIAVYASAIIFGAGTILCGLNMSHIIVGQWFVKFRAKMISINQIALSLAVAALYPVLVAMMQAYGFRTVVMVQTLLCGGLAVVIGIVFKMDSPEKYGKRPYGYELEAVNVSNASSANKQVEGLPLSAILKSSAFWGILICIFFGTVASRAYGSNNVAYFESIGLSSMDAAWVVSGASLAGMIIQFLFGILSDKIGPHVAGFIFGWFVAIGFMLAFLWKGLVLAMVAMVLFSCTSAMSSLLGPSAFPAVFGRRETGNMMGYAHFASSAGNLVGPIISGFMFDALGSYTMAFTIVGVAVAIGLVIMKITTSKKNLTAVAEQRKAFAANAD